MNRAGRMLLLGAILSFSGAVFGQTQFESEIRRQSLDSFPGASAVSESEEFRARLTGHLQKLEQEEKELIALKERMEAFGYSSIDFLNLMANTSTQDAVMREKIKGIVAQAKPIVTEFNTRLDNYIQDTLDLSIAIGLNAARAELAKMSYRNSDLHMLYWAMVKQKNEYLKLKPVYGEGPDAHRVTAHTKFFSNLKNLFVAIENPVFSRTRRYYGKVESLVSKVQWIRDRPELVRAFIDTLKFIMKTPQPEGNSNPLMSAVNKLSRQLGEEMGITVTVEGKENLPGPGAPDEITILVPSHRQMIKDQVGIANLHFEDGSTEFDIDRVAPFAAAHVYPGFIVKKLNPSNGIVVVGPKASTKPIPKALQIADQTDLRMFMNYAGGRLPDGFGSTTGVRKKFFEMVKALEDAGFKVNILAVAMRDNAKLFGGRDLTGNPNITVKVVPVLKHETRHLIMDVAGEDAVGLMMRVGLVQDLVTNDDLIFGQVRGSKLAEAMSEYIFGEVNCEKLLK